jgi:ABC-type Zn2+ transport system substrate-binding protein/surface adhesin
MNRIVCFPIHLVVCLWILGVGQPFIDIDDTKNHLNIYAEVNKTHHDNIDDTAQEHSHSHKHSEDGEEHEHNHEHSKITQHIAKVLSQMSYIDFNGGEFETTQGIFEKHLISSPHLLRLFKPPIT